MSARRKSGIPSRASKIPLPSEQSRGADATSARKKTGDDSTKASQDHPLPVASTAHSEAFHVLEPKALDDGEFSESSSPPCSTLQEQSTFHQRATDVAESSGRDSESPRDYLSQSIQLKRMSQEEKVCSMKRMKASVNVDPDVQVMATPVSQMKNSREQLITTVKGTTPGKVPNEQSVTEFPHPGITLDLGEATAGEEEPWPLMVDPSHDSWRMEAGVSRTDTPEGGAGAGPPGTYGSSKQPGPHSSRRLDLVKGKFQSFSHSRRPVTLSARRTSLDLSQGIRKAMSGVASALGVFEAKEDFESASDDEVGPGAHGTTDRMGPAEEGADDIPSGKDAGDDVSTGGGISAYEPYETLPKKDRPSPSPRGLTKRASMIAMKMKLMKSTSIQDTVTLAAFKEALSCKTDLLPRRIYAVLSQSGGQVTKELLVQAVIHSDDGNVEDRLRFAFDVYDVDGSGGIGREDFRQSLQACLAENGLLMEPETLEDVTSLVISTLGSGNEDFIGYDAFRDSVMSIPEVAKSFRSRSASLIPGIAATPGRAQSMLRPVKRAYVYSRNNPQLVFTVCLTVTLCAGAFYWRFSMWAYTPKQELMGWGLPIAKGCGQAMKVCFSVILLPVSRNAITHARNTWLRNIFPLDDMISYHKFVGILGFVFATIHLFFHNLDFYFAHLPKNADKWALAFPSSPKQAKASETYASQVVVTGFGLYAVMLIAYAFALDWPKRAGWMKDTSMGKVLNNFNYFWYTHHLFAVFYVLMVIHPTPDLPDERNEWGKSDYWLWGGIPISIYLVERVLRLYRQTLRKTKVLYTETLPGGVLATYISRPKRFHYKSGMYVFINCQKISRFEWHPYSLTSAPEDAYIRLHIASLGDWSTAIRELFTSEDVQAKIRQSPLSRTISPTIMQMSAGIPAPSESAMALDATVGSLAGTVELGGPIPDELQILVDGPYGAPAQSQEQYRVLCLVGAGIGITPFASMLRHFMHQFNEHRCSHCGKVSFGPNFRLRKVYFFWVLRDPRSAIWFNKELHAISRDDHNHILEVNIHVTGIQKPTDVRSKLLQLTQILYHKHSGIDIITGVAATSLTKFGRPNWQSVFKMMKARHPKTTVGVLFCGSPLLGKTLRKLCIQSSQDSITKFDFISEKF